MKILEYLWMNGNGEYKDIVSENTSIILSQKLESFGFNNTEDFYIMDSGNDDNTYDIIFYNKVCAEGYLELLNLEDR